MYMPEIYKNTVGNFHRYNIVTLSINRNLDSKFAWILEIFSVRGNAVSHK